MRPPVNVLDLIRQLKEFLLKRVKLLGLPNNLFA
jgi:hypothetical protein